MSPELGRGGGHKLQHNVWRAAARTYLASLSNIELEGAVHAFLGMVEDEERSRRVSRSAVSNRQPVEAKTNAEVKGGGGQQAKQTSKQKPQQQQQQQRQTQARKQQPLNSQQMGDSAQKSGLQAAKQTGQLAPKRRSNDQQFKQASETERPVASDSVPSGGVGAIGKVALSKSAKRRLKMQAKAAARKQLLQQQQQHPATSNTKPGDKSAQASAKKVSTAPLAHGINATSREMQNKQQRRKRIEPTRQDVKKRSLSSAASSKPRIGTPEKATVRQHQEHNAVGEIVNQQNAGQVAAQKAKVAHRTAKRQVSSRAQSGSEVDAKGTMRGNKLTQSTPTQQLGALSRAQPKQRAKSQTQNQPNQVAQPQALVASQQLKSRARPQSQQQAKAKQQAKPQARTPLQKQTRLQAEQKSRKQTESISQKPPVAAGAVVLDVHGAQQSHTPQDALPVRQPKNRRRRNKNSHNEVLKAQCEATPTQYAVPRDMNATFSCHAAGAATSVTPKADPPTRRVKPAARSGGRDDRRGRGLRLSPAAGWDQDVAAGAGAAGAFPPSPDYMRSDYGASTIREEDDLHDDDIY